MRVALLAVAFAVSLLPTRAPAHDAAEARYLGNEGVLVARGDTKILFDAFYAESFGGTYTLVPNAIESAMLRGEPPFDGIDAIFISHIHPDHFNSRKTIAYMRANPGVRLYAGMDVVGAIRAADASSDPLMDRVVAIHVPVGDKPASYAVGGLAIDAFAIPHSGDGPVPHYAYRVTLDGATTVMHLGDATDTERHYEPDQRAFNARRPHMAFVPSWLMTSESGKRILEQRIRPRAVIGIHVEEKARRSPANSLRQAGGDLFLEPGETRRLPGGR